MKKHQLQQCQHWIFDMDGTLTISAHDFEYIRSELGIAPSVPILEALNAMPDEKSAPLWLKLNRLEEEFAEQSSLMYGALDLVEKLYTRGVQLAILTRNTMPVVEKTLKACGLDHFFPHYHRLDRDSCTPKPSPDGINHLLDLWKIDASNAVMVGDYVFDLQAGRSAGVTTIHLDTRGIDWPECTDIKIKHLDELGAFL